MASVFSRPSPAPFTREIPPSSRSLPSQKHHIFTSAQAQQRPTEGNRSSPADNNVDTTATTSSRRALLASSLVALPLAITAASPSTAAAAATGDGAITRVFFDMEVDRQPFGRIVIAIDGAASGARIGAQRFVDLAVGIEGVSYRRTKFELLQDGYIQDSGVKALSYKANGSTRITGGPDAEYLEDELAASTQKHDAEGVVSLFVRLSDEKESNRVSKDKLVAVKGQFVTVNSTLGEVPNGSGFAITTRPEPGLDGTHLVVGRVVEGMDVVKALAALPRVRDNSKSPFFMAGKAAGDLRANVAERAFGKAFNKIVIEQSGVCP